MSAFIRAFARLSPSRALLLLVIFCAACLSSCAAGNVEDTAVVPDPDAAPKIYNTANLDVPRLSFPEDIVSTIDVGSSSTDTPSSAFDASSPDRLSVLITNVDAGTLDAGTARIDVPQPLDTGEIQDAPLLDRPLPPSDTGANDAGFVTDTRPSLAPELCNGRDDNGNGLVDEIFECSLGRRGDTCVTRCGANGHRLCGSTCRWDPVCQTYAEVCNDTIDNDCNGQVDCADSACRNAAHCKVVPPPPPDAGSPSVDAGRTDGCHELVIRLDYARLPVCSSGRVIILYDNEGRPHESAPGAPLIATLCGRLRGGLMVSTRCAGSYLVNWPGPVGRPVREGGVASVALDGDELADREALLCLDEWSPTPGVRPFIPLESFFYARCP